MSFTWHADKPLLTREQWMRIFIEVADELDMPDRRGACICATMCAFQEAGGDPHKTGQRQIWIPGNNNDPAFRADPNRFRHDSLSNDGASTGAFQQQAGANWGWGGNLGDPEGTRKRMDPRESTRMFMGHPSSGLKRKGYNASNAQSAGDSIQRVQGSSFPRAYDKWWDEANRLYDAVKEDGSVAVSGDPVWLERVWRDALGDRLVVHPGWEGRGVGGVMGVIWGTMIHHTGNDNERVEVIRDGVQQPSGWLPGPLSQALITRDGKLHLIAVGPCNHAGSGNWGSLTDGNRQSIGIECAYDGNPARWPDVMVITMRDATAAVSKHIGKRAADSVCGHKEYAKPPGRKVDPGNMDMNWFRGEVQKDLDGFVFPGEGLTTPVPPKPVTPPPTSYTVPPNHTALTYDQITGRWEMLGWNTVVETLAELRDAITGSRDAGKPGMVRGPRPPKEKA